MTMQSRTPSGLRRALFTLGVCLPLALGCDVTNPGPVQDQFLDQPAAHAGLVNGAGRMLVQSANEIFSKGGVVAREIFPVGSTNWGFTPLIQGGHFRPDDVDLFWNNAQEARFIAEEAVSRFAELDNVAPEVEARASLFAGYANRVLGENMCEAVFNGGPAEPNIRYFERAEDHFTAAINATTGATQTAAYAGRAQVRVWLEDWAGATSDAQNVGDDFLFALATDSRDQEVQNRFWWYNINLPYRVFTIWNTFFEDYYAETGDPRTPWATGRGATVGEGTLTGFGVVPWIFELKYPTGDTPFPFAKGGEMRLIEAEALLVQGRWQEAMDLINEVRTSHVSDITGEPLEPWVAQSLVEAWTYLKRERSIELWLEGRRLGDLRRWEENGTPGQVDWPDFESISPIFTAAPRSDCIPISQTELDTNDNL